jgi:hypothetical protein
MIYEELLFGSESLTREEEALRAELLEWCREKLANGARPIPLQAALLIASDIMRSPDSAGLRGSGSANPVQ